MFGFYSFECVCDRFWCLRDGLRVLGVGIRRKLTDLGEFCNLSRFAVDLVWLILLVCCCNFAGLPV